MSVTRLELPECLLPVLANPDIPALQMFKACVADVSEHVPGTAVGMQSTDIAEDMQLTFCWHVYGMRLTSIGADCLDILTCYLKNYYAVHTYCYQMLVVILAFYSDTFLSEPPRGATCTHAQRRCINMHTNIPTHC